MDVGDLRRAHQSFHDVLAQVRDEQFDLATPCADWSVRDLVQHVVGGERMVVPLLAGSTAEEALQTLRAADPGVRPLDAFDDAAGASAAAFGSPGAQERLVHHMVGDIPGSQFLQMRIGDVVLHGWDLARAVGADEEIDPALVEGVWGLLEPLTPMIANIGVFGDGPSGVVDAGAPLQQRLLDLSGRRP